MNPSKGFLRALLLPAAGLFLFLPLRAQAPQWWAARGSIVDGATTSDYSAATQGQLKQMARLAMEEMDASIPGGAGTAIHAMVDGWVNDSTHATDYAAATLANLKVVATPFYDRLQKNYPWSESNVDDSDFAVVTIGQVKNAFSFEIDASEAVDQVIVIAEDTYRDIQLGQGSLQGAVSYQILTPPSNGELVGTAPSLTYRPNAHFFGADSVTFEVGNGTQSLTGTISITVNPVDDPPLVDSGEPVIAVVGQPLAISGTVTDIDTAPTAIATLWSKSSGPGNVDIDDDEALSTTATFDAAGDYVLELTAYGGGATRSDDLFVKVREANAPVGPSVELAVTPSEMVRPTAFHLTANVTGTCTKVVFQEGKNVLGTDTSAPFEYVWKTNVRGKHRIHAFAYNGTAFSRSNKVEATVLRPGDPGGSDTDDWGFGNNGNPFTGGNGGDDVGNPPGPNPPGNDPDVDSEFEDSDDDGLSDAEEDRLGTNRNDEDSDNDGIPDGEDAWANVKKLTLPRIAESRYTVLDLTAAPFGIPSDATLIGMDDFGDVAYCTTEAGVREDYVLRMDTPEIIPVDFRIESISSKGVLAGGTAPSGDDRPQAVIWDFRNSASPTYLDFPESVPSDATVTLTATASNGSVTAGRGYASWVRVISETESITYSWAYGFRYPYGDQPVLTYHESSSTGSSEEPDYRTLFSDIYGKVVNASDVIGGYSQIGSIPDEMILVTGTTPMRYEGYNFQDLCDGTATDGGSALAVGRDEVSGYIFLQESTSSLWTPLPLEVFDPDTLSLSSAFTNALQINTRGELLATDGLVRNGVLRRFATLINDWTIASNGGAIDLNNEGMILAEGSPSGGGEPIPVLLIPFEVIPTDDASANADQTIIYFTAGIPGTDEENPFAEGGTIEWEVEEGNGTLSETETTIAGGYATVGLDVSNAAVGEKIKVKARLKKLSATGAAVDSSWVSSGEVEVFAGYPDSVTVTTSKEKLHNDGVETTEVEATFVDADGNPVMDGTPVDWSVLGTDTQFTEMEESTTDGKAKATLRSGILAGDVTLRVSAGNAVYAEDYSVELLGGSLQSNRSSIDVATGQTATLTLNVNAEDDTPVYWFTSTGEITESSTVSGGSATATLSSTSAELGKVVVWAAVGGKSFLWQGTITASQGLHLGAEHKVIAAGMPSDGIVTVTMPANVGDSLDVPYYTHTKIYIKGSPNSTVTLEVPNYSAPPAMSAAQTSSTTSSSNSLYLVPTDANGDAEVDVDLSNAPEGDIAITASDPIHGELVFHLKAKPVDAIGLATTIVDGLLGEGGDSLLGVASEIAGGLFFGPVQDSATILKNVGRLCGVVEGDFDGGQVMWAMAGFIPGTHIAKAIGKVAEVIGSGKALTKVLSAAASEAYKVDGDLDEFIDSGKFAFANRLHDDPALITKLDSANFNPATLDHCGRIEKELGDAFFTKLKQINGSPDELVGVIDAIGGGSDEALHLLQSGGLNGGTLQTAMDGVHEAVKAGHDPATLTKVLNKVGLDTPSHNRVDLLTDLGKKGSDGKALAEAEGMKELVNKMTWPGKGGRGYKFELRYAEHFQSQGYKVVSVDSKIAFDPDLYEAAGSGGLESWFRTDMDLHLEKGGTTYHVQVKSSYAAVNASKGHRALRNYFGASKLADPASKEMLAIPSNVNIARATQRILDAQEEAGRTVEVIRALTP